MRTVTRIAVVITALVAAHIDVAAQDILDRFVARYRHIGSIRFSFEGAGVKGSLVADGKGRYKVNAGDRTFVCNANTVWNIDARTKTVVINAFDWRSEDGNLARLFLTVMGAYTPTLVRDFGTGSTAIIRLDAPSNQMAVISNIRIIEAEVTRDLKVVRLTVNDGAVTTWKLSKMQFNPPTSSSTFSLPDTEGYTVVDLR
jgi:outer membrane lipoprotein-sorting protein